LKPAVLKKVNDIIGNEIKYLSKFYAYNIEDFKDCQLLHANSMLVFKDPESKLPDKPSDKPSDRSHIKTSNKPTGIPPGNFMKRIISLMAGIELLSIGLNLHTFNVDDFIMQSNKNNPGSKSKNPIKTGKNPVEKNYTVDLLFGDVFYSRAVIYILEYGDFHIFNSILDSLKSAHRSRLLLYGKFIQDSNVENFGKRINQLIEENEILIMGINSLLKTSFFIGWGIFSNTERFKLPYEIVNDFILLKTLVDVVGFFDRFPEYFDLSGNKAFLDERRKVIKKDLTGKIKAIEPSHIKDNFLSLKL
jgi:hypothetical protein